MIAREEAVRERQRVQAGSRWRKADLYWDTRLLSVTPKDSHAPALAELGSLVVEVLSDADVLHQSPFLT